MKKYIAIIGLLVFVTVNGFCETWVFHGCKDNYSEALFYEDISNGSMYALRWDWNYDQEYPTWADSGISFNWENASGYNDTLTFECPSGYILYGIAVSAPWPDYNNGQLFGYQWDYQLHKPAQYNIPSGEYWVDFASDGTGRLSITQPADFGKWAWDGSINPSWIEPETAILQHGKKIGHVK